MMKKSLRHILTGAIALSLLVQLPTPTAAAADPNVAKGKRAYACHEESASLTTAQALDGNGNTRFAAGPGCQHDTYFVLDLGSRYDISGIKITWEAAFASKYAVEVSDDGQIFTTVSAETVSSAGTKTTSLDAAGRFVRIREISRVLSQYGFSIYELEVYGTLSAQQNNDDYVIVTAADSTHGSLSLSHTGFVKVGATVTATAIPDGGLLQSLTYQGKDVTSDVQNNKYTFTAEHDATLFATFSAPLKSSFECEDVTVYTALDLSTQATPNVQSDAAASGGKVAGGTGGKYFLFENVSEANCIKLAYASPNTNSINVWVRYPGETELRAFPAIPFSTSNSWTMDSSASYTATSPVFYVPAGSDIVLRPNVDCNLDKMWLSFENNVTSDSAPANTVPADRLGDAKEDIMAPYSQAVTLTKGQSLTFTVPDAQALYNVLTLSYCSEGAAVEFSANGMMLAAASLEATALRTYEVHSVSSAEFAKGDAITLTCVQGALSIGYAAVNHVPKVNSVSVSTLPAAGDRLTVNLNGTWAFDAEPFATWSVDPSVPEIGFVSAIPVPGLWSSAAMDMGDSAGQKAWYKKTVVLPDEPSGNVTLYIEQAQYGRYVYINGTLVDTYEYNYSASYSDLTGLLHKGENEIVIMLGDFSEQFSSKTDKAHVLYDGESRFDLPGITGSVELIFNANPTVSKVQTNPNVENGTLDVQVTLANGKSQSVCTDVTVTVYELGVYKDGKPTMDEIKVAEYVQKNVTVKPGENDALLIEDVALDSWTRDKCWTPDSPYLYRVEIRTSGDTYTTRIGMRTFGYDPETKYYTLNGELLYLRGTNVAIERYYDDPLCGTTPWQEDWVRKLYSEFKATNWFCFRTHLGNANELWFDLADEMGFLIIDEYPQWGDLDGCTAESNMPEIYAWIDLRANHPSLFMFDAQNEASGTTYTDEICRLGRAYDLQNRTWDNGWRPPVFEDSPIECHPYFLGGQGVSGIGGDKYSKPVLTMANIGWTCETYPDQPFILNEHGELWVSRDGIPMSGTAGTWNVHLPNASPEQRLTYYADVMAAQAEAFRAQRAYSGLLFFCGLGSDFPDHVGITCDILSPDVSSAESLQIRPYIQELLKNAFADLGIVTEYYEETVKRGREIEVPVKLVNDTGKNVDDLTVTLTVQSGETVLYADRATISVAAFSADNDGLATHTFKVTVPTFEGYCNDGEELYLIASYTMDEKTVYSRRKIEIKGGSATTTDPLPEYDWLTPSPEQTTDAPQQTTDATEAFPESIGSDSTTEMDEPKRGCKALVAPITTITVLTAGMVVCKKRKKDA